MGKDHLLHLLERWNAYLHTPRGGEASAALPQDLLDQFQACDGEDLRQLEWLVHHLPAHVNQPTDPIPFENK